MAGYTTGQAGGGATQQLSSVPTAYQTDALELARAQRLAQMLSNPEPAQGQNVSGRFVAPSWTQHLAQLAQAGTGAYFADKAEKQQLDLAKKIREGENVALADYMAGIQGRPATQQQTEMAGPYAGDISRPVATKDIPAVVANPMMANLTAAQDDRLPAWMRQHAIKEATKGPDWKEINQVNKKTGETEIWRYNANSATPRDTLQFLGTSKAAFTPSEVLHLNDQGIGTGQFGNPYGGGSNMPSVGGAGSVNNLPVAGGGTAVGGKPPAIPTAKNDDVVKQFGYNPFEAPKPPPTLTSGAQVRKFYADQATALPAETQKTVRGAINYQKAVGDLQDEFQNYSDLDLAKPSVRAKLQQKVTNAYLLGKESNTLGALTGPDLGLLEKLVFDPTSFNTLILDRKTINSLYDAQRRSAGDTIRESYRQDKKPVPEDMRNNIIVAAKPIPMSQAEIRKEVTAKGITYDPAYEYQINPDGSVDRRKKKK